MNPKGKSQLIYLARLPQYLRDARKGKVEKKEPVSVESGYMRVKRLMDAVEESAPMREAINVATAQAWLNRAYQTIVDRSEEISNIVEKEEYTKLAVTIQAALPVNDAPEETVESNLQILRQQIVIGDQDSKTLRKLKMHLITSIGEVLTQPQTAPAEAPPPGAAPPGAPGEPPGGAPPPGQEEEEGLPGP